MTALVEIYPRVRIPLFYRDLEFTRLISSNPHDFMQSCVRKKRGLSLEVCLDEGFNGWSWRVSCKGGSWGSLTSVEKTLSMAFDRVFYLLFLQESLDTYVDLINDEKDISRDCWNPTSDRIRTGFGDLNFRYSGISCRRWGGTFGENQIHLYEHQNSDTISSSLFFIPRNPGFLSLFPQLMQTYRGGKALMFQGFGIREAENRFLEWLSSIRSLFWSLGDLKPASDAIPWTEHLLKGSLNHA